MSERINEQPEPEVNIIPVEPEEILRRRILEKITKWRSDKASTKASKYQMQSTLKV